MLNELSIRNFAIIEELSISFDKGLTVLSGETGAGKSIIIDSIHLLVGGRGSTDIIRHGEKKTEVEGLFQLDDELHPCYSKLQEFGIESDDGMVVLRRELARTGKSVCRVNGKLVTIAILREIGGTLVDIHGQHEHQELMNETKHLALLDQFGNTKLAPVLNEYEAVYDSYEKASKRLKQLCENEQKMVHRLDLISFQYEEIIKSELRINEDEELLEEKRKYSNYEKLYEALNISYSALRGDQKGLDWVSVAMAHLEDAASLDESYKEMADSVSNSFYVLEDAMRMIRSELDGLEYDPERLNEVESRLHEINQLKRKYGVTIEEVLSYAAKIEEEIETLQNKETHIAQLQREIDALERDLAVEARELSSIRKMYAAELTGLIHNELKELYMEKTVFEVRFTSNFEHFTRTGADTIEFLISPNPGEPLKPLSKIASGGELSRMMLALKSIFSKHQGVTSIIFDEVDTGVSGRVAQAIAEKIYRVSVGSQVLCISHMPQVAAMADTHLYIEKETYNGRTKTTMRTLTDVEKTNEIARMISGVEITDLTHEHARELLHLANEIKIH